MYHATMLLSIFIYTAFAELAPKFNTTPEHVTVKAGNKAILPCSVEYLGDYSVIWVSPRTTLISHEDRRDIDDQRISVERPYVKEWNLHIRNVRYNDSGTYKCQINTNPVQVKEVTLSVLVPPSINSEMSSDDIKLKETETADLVCNVSGVPQPNVTWYKRNYRQGSGHKERIGLEGELLVIHNVSRYCDDIYECFVNNGVSPSVSKAIRVIVEFAPEVIIPTRRIGQRLNRETILECKIYAHPQLITVWKRNGVPISTSGRFTVEAYTDIENRLVTLSLRINHLKKEDYGKYVCEGSNSLGSDEEEMILYEIEPEVITTTRTTTTLLGPRYEVLPDRFSGYNNGLTSFHKGKKNKQQYDTSTRRLTATYPKRPAKQPTRYGFSDLDNNRPIQAAESSASHTQSVILTWTITKVILKIHQML